MKRVYVLFETTADMPEAPRRPVAAAADLIPLVGWIQEKHGKHTYDFALSGEGRWRTINADGSEVARGKLLYEMTAVTYIARGGAGATTQDETGR